MGQAKRNRGIILGVIVVAIFLYSIRNVGQLAMPYIVDDEFGYWSVGAWIAGYDWSGITRWCGYYSYGYGVILAIFIKIFGTMEMAYKGAICFNAILLVGSFLLARKLINKYYSNISFGLSVLIAILCVLVPNNLYHVNIAWPEVLLGFIVWVSLFLLFKYLEKGKVIYLYVLSSILIYSYMVHNRSLVLLCMFILLVAVKKDIKKRDKLQLLFIAFFGLLAGQMLKSYFYSNLWKSSRVAAGNSVEALFKSFLKIIVNFDSLNLFIQDVIGKVWYFSVAMFSLMFIGGIEFIRKIKISNFDINKTIFIELFLWGSFILEIGLTALQMLGSEKNSQSINVLLYGRYADIFVGPILFVILMNLYNTRKYVNFYRPFLAVVISFVANIGMGFIIKNIILNNGLISFGSMNSIFLRMFWDGKELHVFSAAIFSFIVGIVISYVLICADKFQHQYMTILVGLLSCYYACTAQCAVDDSVLSFQKSQAYIKTIANEKILNSEHEIGYLLNGTKVYNVYDNRIKNIVQFYNPQIRIVGALKIEKLKNIEKIICTVNNQGLLKCLLDNYTIVYKENDVLILKKNKHKNAEWKNIDNALLEMGGDAVYAEEKIYAKGEQGHFISSRPYELDKGEYTIKAIMKANEISYEDAQKEIGFIYADMGDKEIARQNIYYDGGDIEVDCSVNLDKGADNIRIHIYLYDNIKVQFEGMYIR